MTYYEAMNLLKSTGIKFDGNELLLDGEVVGHLWETHLVISNEIPSLYNKLYADMEKTRINLSIRAVEDDILMSVRWLKSSKVRYEKTFREMRISNVRKYFDKKKEEQKEEASLADLLEKKLEELETNV